MAPLINLPWYIEFCLSYPIALMLFADLSRSLQEDANVEQDIMAYVSIAGRCFKGKAWH